MSFFEIDAKTTAMNILCRVMQVPTMFVSIVFLIVVVPIALAADLLEKIIGRGRLYSFRKFMQWLTDSTFTPIARYHNWCVEITTTEKQKFWNELKAVEKQQEKTNE